MKHWNAGRLVCLIAIPFTAFAGGFDGASLHNDSTITIPIDLGTHRPIVALTVNGKGPFHFIFDTGASGSVIDQDLATLLGAEVIGHDSLNSPGSSNRILSDRVRVTGVSFAGMTVTQDLFMNVLSLKKILPVDGVLSPTIFQQYLVTIDYAHSLLFLNRGELDRADSSIVPLIRNSGMIAFEAVVDGNKVPAHLDSGNPGGFDVPYSLKDKLRFAGVLTEGGVINTPAARFNRWRASLTGDINVGRLVFHNPDIGLVEGFEALNIGYRVVKDLSITIDANNKLVKLAVSSPPSGGEDQLKSDLYQFSGWYGGHERRVFSDGQHFYLERADGPSIKLVSVKNDEYEMVFPMPVQNELPHVRFDRDSNCRVKGLTFLFSDGREEFVPKDR